MRKFWCPKCQSGEEYEWWVVKRRIAAGLRMMCRGCSGPLEVLSPERGSDNVKRSKAQEKRAAERYGARTQPASGSGREKGDFRKKGVSVGECKFTRAASFSLKLADLQKLEQVAKVGENPVFEIEFQGVHPNKRYVVLPGWLYDHYEEVAGSE